jgi:hypothetical protein
MSAVAFLLGHALVHMPLYPCLLTDAGAALS